MRLLAMTSWLVLLLVIAGGCDSSLESRGEQLTDKFRRLQLEADKFAKDVEAESRKVQAEVERLGKLRDAVVKPVGPTPSPVVPTPQPLVPTPKPDTPNPVVPTPTPKPFDPEPADGRFAIAKSVYRIGMTVDSKNRGAEAAAIAAVFESTAASVAAGSMNGTLLNPQWRQISAKLAQGNKPIISGNSKAWEGPADKLGDAIGQFYSDGKLDKNEDWSDLLNEIANGLKAVK